MVIIIEEAVVDEAEKKDFREVGRYGYFGLLMMKNDAEVSMDDERLSRKQE